jgi:hypothetical protein
MAYNYSKIKGFNLEVFNEVSKKIEALEALKTEIDGLIERHQLQQFFAETTEAPTPKAEAPAKETKSKAPRKPRTNPLEPYVHHFKLRKLLKDQPKTDAELYDALKNEEGFEAISKEDFDKNITYHANKETIKKDKKGKWEFA